MLEFQNPGFNPLGGILRKDKLINLRPSYFDNRVVAAIYPYVHRSREMIEDENSRKDNRVGRVINNIGARGETQ